MIINAENYEPKKGDIFGKINCNVNTYVEHIAEEIADVTVMLKQFQYLYEIEDKTIDNIMDKKINRQLERIGDENNKKILINAPLTYIISIASPYVPKRYPSCLATLYASITLS